MARFRPLRTDGGVFAHERDHTAGQPVDRAFSLVTAWAVAAAIVAASEDAAKMLLEGDVGFFRDAVRVGIEGLEKIIYFPPHVRIMQNGLTRQDLAVHFLLHFQSSPAQRSLSLQAATHHCCDQTRGWGISFGGKRINASE